MELFGAHTIGSPGLWVAFLGLVAVMLAVDLGLFHRKAHEVSLREAATWSAIWVAISGALAVFMHRRFGAEMALEFVTGYVLEKALSVDNIFVFVVVFAAFGVPARLQHRVLFWGVLGALVLRAIFIFAGTAMIQHFHFTLYLFGAVLVATGVRLLWSGGDQPPGEGRLVRFVRRVVPMTPHFEEAHFFVVRDGRRVATPLVATLVTVELTDVVFAVDSIPAVFAVTDDPFVVFTSNICAILGLRSMYFLLAGVLTRFRHLKIGLALVLTFVGGKMLLGGVLDVSVLTSLVVIATLLTGSIAASLVHGGGTSGEPPAG